MCTYNTCNTGNASFTENMTTTSELTKESAIICQLISGCFDTVVHEATRAHLIASEESATFLQPSAEHMAQCLNRLLECIRRAIDNDAGHMETFLTILRNIQHDDIADQLGMQQ